jgi:uncharacterized protein
MVSIDTVLLKVTSRCNLDCSYCYVYNMGDEGWRAQPKRMSQEVLSAVVGNLTDLAVVQQRGFSVVLHGGEPFLLGAPALGELFGRLRTELSDRCDIHAQSNGLLLENDLIELLVRYQVGVSISVDGPATVHDAFRVDPKGSGSHRRVMAAIDRLRRYPGAAALFTGVLCVVDPRTDAAAVYAALKATGAPSFDFLYRDGNCSRLPFGKATLNSAEYGRWMCGLLDVYLSDPNPPRVRILDDMLKLLLGGAGEKEGVGLTDYGIVVIDTDGEITKNDTLKVAYPEADRFARGWSVLKDRLVDVVNDPEFATYHRLQRPTATACQACSDLSVCGGGMPAHRWSDETGYDNPSVFCADQKLLIAHMRRWLERASIAASQWGIIDHERQSEARKTR